MIATNPTVMTVEIGTEIGMAAETATAIESEETEVVTSHAERLTGIKS